MAFTKFASLEDVEILDVKGSQSQRVASLDKIADFEDYRTDDGYLYARIRAISSRVNKNHDGWPSVELAGGQEIFDKHAGTKTGAFTASVDKEASYGYSTFLGKPIFVDHNNSDPSRARGVIVDAKLHVEDQKTSSLDPYYAGNDVNPLHVPPTWVELLLEVDAKSFPKFAQAIIDGGKDSTQGIDGFSMGANVERTECNICKNSATTPDEFCKHVQNKGALYDYIDPETGQKTAKRSYEDCFGVQFFEISGVFDPADETALVREVVAGTKEAAIGETIIGEQPCPSCGSTMTVAFPSSQPQRWSAICCATCGNELVPTGATQQMAPDWRETITEAVKNGYMPGSPGATPFDPNAWTIQRNQHTTREGALHENPNPQEEGQGSVACPECEGRGFDRNLDDCTFCKGNVLKGGPEARPSSPGGDGGASPQLLDTEDFTHPPIQRKKNEVKRLGKVASNDAPQSELIHVPDEVDTLRKERICDICGSNMDSEQCDVCGYIEPPEGFDNPDLTKAKPSKANEEVEPEPEGLASNPPTTAHVNGSEWKISMPSRVAETVVTPSKGPASDEPEEEVVKDPATPVTSSVRTAADFLAAAGVKPQGANMKRKADAATGAPEVATPDTNVDADGVGGVQDASNEQASKADTQTDVLGVGGVGVEGVEADSTVSVDQGDEHSKNIEAIPTKTFGDGGSAVERQAEPVSGQPFPASEDGVKSSGWRIEALDSGAFPRTEDSPAGGSTTKGVGPTDPVGNPDQRVDLLEPATSPANNSGPTKTWSGTDGNGVLRQQEPTTNTTLEGTDGVKASNTKLMQAFKLADLEIDLGLLDKSQKYARVDELQSQSSEAVASHLSYAEKVKTAGLGKGSPKTAMRLPSLARSASVESTKSTGGESPDEALFT